MLLTIYVLHLGEKKEKRAFVFYAFFRIELIEAEWCIYICVKSVSQHLFR